MRKFTVFTVILTLIVVVVAAQVVANQYWPSLELNSLTNGSTNPLPNSLNLSANVLGSDSTAVQDPVTSKTTTPAADTNIGLNIATLPTPEFGDGLDLPASQSDTNGLNTVNLPITADSSNNIPSTDLSGNTTTGTTLPSPQNPVSGDAGDFESSNFKPSSLNVYLNQDQLKSAGFTNTTLETEDFDGFLYKTIYTQDLKDLKVFKNVIKSADSILCKVYIIDIGPMNTPKDVYDTLKARGSEGLDVEINETNAFGDSSFFMNDSRRQNVAFLTVRFGNLIYGFSYPKEYHPQVQNLIKLLDMEF